MKHLGALSSGEFFRLLDRGDTITVYILSSLNDTFYKRRFIKLTGNRVRVEFTSRKDDALILSRSHLEDAMQSAFAGVMFLNYWHAWAAARRIRCQQET